PKSWHRQADLRMPKTPSPCRSTTDLCSSSPNSAGSEARPRTRQDGRAQQSYVLCSANIFGNWLPGSSLVWVWAGFCSPSGEVISKASATHVMRRRASLGDPTLLPLCDQPPDRVRATNSKRIEEHLRERHRCKKRCARLLATPPVNLTSVDPEPIGGRGQCH